MKWRPDLTTAESKLLNSVPKAVLFVVARQLAATVDGHCDDLQRGSSLVLKEWQAQYYAGNVPQMPPHKLFSGSILLEDTD
jgi:hypothetical protein